MISIIGAMIACVYMVYPKRDRLVTTYITMDYFVDTVNNYNEEKVKSFVAKSSRNDVLFNNFLSTLKDTYHYKGISDFKFEITNQEVYEEDGNGKYQCYFSSKVTKCDTENEGRYMNYLIDIDISYTFEEKVYNEKEKGLVVFVKDMSKGNYFTWKLVRFDRYRITDSE